MVFGTLSRPLWRHCYDADGHLHIQHWWVRGPQIAPQNPTAKENCGVPFVQDWSLSLCCMQSAIWHSLSTPIITQSNVTCHTCTALTNLSFFRKSFLTWLYLILHWRPITLYCHYSYDRDISRVECITIWMTCYALSLRSPCAWWNGACACELVHLLLTSVSGPTQQKWLSIADDSSPHILNLRHYWYFSV